ncbi:phosphotransferase [Paenibacillus daejeonensis]|uniref:phosphotransferase n=1 Tax=Paenibacillus daejeonensis TaxID=135193 RepID=UPI00037B6970|nr:phosphotransferase [Paenibacillus daejeonensis]
MESNKIVIAQGLADVLQRGQVRQIAQGRMTEAERGWSGAEVRRMEVTYTSGRQESMIFKEALLKERMVMKRLTDQGHQNTPAAFSLDTESDEPRWMALEDVGSIKTPPQGQEWSPKVAEALARIHTRNLRKGSEMPWLPHADRVYWERYLVTKVSVDHFEKLTEQNPNFGREFGAYLPTLREKANVFARDMAALYDEKDSLTLTHGDLQSIDGSHVHYLNDKPYLIDFGWCYYAPFYIDLVSYFTIEEAKVYYNHFINSGVSLSYDDFYERLRATFCYSGLIYLYPSMMQWSTGPTEQTGKRLLHILKIILTGEFPERRIDYSNELFSKLLTEHNSGTLDIRKN